MAFGRPKKHAVREDARRFNPETANGVRTSNVYHGKATSTCCPEHGWYKTVLGGGTTNWCPKCADRPAPKKGVQVRNPDSAVTGWYEHIDTKPIYIESRAQLYRECAKRGLQARALMSGGEMKRPKGA
jgi:hypothetical protein